VPATGYRNNTTGALVNVGTWGAYYSSSPLLSGNIDASHLAFGSGDVHPLNNANRANALSVRCVQHLRSSSAGPRTSVDKNGFSRPGVARATAFASAVK